MDNNAIYQEVEKLNKAQGLLLFKELAELKRALIDQQELTQYLSEALAEVEVEVHKKKWYQFWKGW